MPAAVFAVQLVSCRLDCSGTDPLSPKCQLLVLSEPRHTGFFNSQTTPQVENRSAGATAFELYNSVGPARHHVSASRAVVQS